MNIKKEMYSPENTTGASRAKGKYSANILLQDLEEDNEKSLSSNLNETWTSANCNGSYIRRYVANVSYSHLIKA